MSTSFGEAFGLSCVLVSEVMTGWFFITMIGLGYVSAIRLPHLESSTVISVREKFRTVAPRGVLALLLASTQLVFAAITSTDDALAIWYLVIALLVVTIRMNVLPINFAAKKPQSQPVVTQCFG